VGRKAFLVSFAERQTRGMYEDVEVAVVEGRGHWCAVENPRGFGEEVAGACGQALGWISWIVQRHETVAGECSPSLLELP
jgi:hypothetical protein